jgi:hypothetical protein
MTVTMVPITLPALFLRQYLVGLSVLVLLLMLMLLVPPQVRQQRSTVGLQASPAVRARARARAQALELAQAKALNLQTPGAVQNPAPAVWGFVRTEPSVQSGLGSALAEAPLHEATLQARRALAMRVQRQLPLACWLPAAALAVP